MIAPRSASLSVRRRLCPPKALITQATAMHVTTSRATGIQPAPPNWGKRHNPTSANLGGPRPRQEVSDGRRRSPLDGECSARPGCVPPSHQRVTHSGGESSLTAALSLSGRPTASRVSKTIPTSGRVEWARAPGSGWEPAWSRHSLPAPRLTVRAHRDLLEHDLDVHNRSSGKRSRRIGFDYVRVAVDDHSRLAFARILPNE